MDKKQAQQEILRRLKLYFKRFAVDANYNTVLAFNKYRYGLISKQELIKMITLDENGNLLSEPFPPDYDVEDCFTELGKEEVRKAWLIYGEKKTEYQKALNQGTEIVNCYEGTDVI